MDQVEKNKEEMLKLKTWAVVGVTPDEEKFGYKIYQKLKNHGYHVYAVNPKYDSVEGDIIYNSLKDLPEKPECVNIVVNPKVAKGVLEEVKALGIQYVWFQPGTFDEETIAHAEEAGLNIVYYDCVLVALG
ncbi:CoA-binding domain protein [Alkaliphilus metalliredigens QYMF]|uniref:CoA-binding domain protein n=1 Tax=Alkaliphilus metalliredigens (strain QYMF) TaxID=293826 RepID=A6TQC0_ALKMQ|nr:CoA-binding protein [Alkaliphilus metalliredigens]ABR48388.1 CoA-binding domain protein [Alkaliphilus metalliredigens QYMF]